jgi:hypothetical protein
VIDTPLHEGMSATADLTGDDRAGEARHPKDFGRRALHSRNALVNWTLRDDIAPLWPASLGGFVIYTPSLQSHG